MMVGGHPGAYGRTMASSRLGLLQGGAGVPLGVRAGGQVLEELDSARAREGAPAGSGGGLPAAGEANRAHRFREGVVLPERGGWLKSVQDILTASGGSAPGRSATISVSGARRGVLGGAQQKNGPRTGAPYLQDLRIYEVLKPDSKGVWKEFRRSEVRTIPVSWA